MSDRRTAYVVVSGEYSDYRIRAVYDDKALAEKHVETYPWRAYDWGRVEEFPLNGDADAIARGLFAFGVGIDRDGGEAQAHVDETGIYDSSPRIRAYSNAPDRLYLDVTARDATHAIKIANERRTHLLATGEWDRLRDAGG
jgi:hypothetical protein